MAIYNEILSARFSRLLQKLFSMKGPQAAKQLAGEVSPTLNLFSGVENRYLEGWHRYGLAFSFAASAANINQFRMRVPGTTFPSPTQGNVVAVVEKFTYNNNGAAADSCNLSHGAAGTDLGNIMSLPLARFDPRQGATIASNLILSNVQQVANVGLGQIKYISTLPVNGNVDVIFQENQEIPLLPGDALHFANFVVNNNSAISVWWRERVLEESERF